MTGILAAVAGGTQNVIYAAGLYNVSLSAAAQSPIAVSGSSASGAVTYNYTWIGYYKHGSTGSVTLGLSTSYTEYINYFGQTLYNWGGGGYTIGYLWFGPTAKSGYTTGNANIVANTNTTTNYTTSMVAGIYYPIRIQMVMYLPYDPYAYYSGGQYGQYYPGYAVGGFNFQSGGNINVSGLIFYNTKSPGF